MATPALERIERELRRVEELQRVYGKPSRGVGRKGVLLALGGGAVAGGSLVRAYDVHRSKGRVAKGLPSAIRRGQLKVAYERPYPVPSRHGPSKNGAMWLNEKVRATTFGQETGGFSDYGQDAAQRAKKWLRGNPVDGRKVRNRGKIGRADGSLGRMNTAHRAREERLRRLADPNSRLNKPVKPRYSGPVLP